MTARLTDPAGHMIDSHWYGESSREEKSAFYLKKSNAFKTGVHFESNSSFAPNEVMLYYIWLIFQGN